MCRLEEATKLYDGVNDIVRDSIIQRFEFTFTLSITLLKIFMEEEGLVLENTYPRYILKKAYQNKLIENEETWLNILEDRNQTSYIYSQNMADEISNRIVNEYLGEFQALLEKIKMK